MRWPQKPFIYVESVSFERHTRMIDGFTTESVSRLGHACMDKNDEGRRMREKGRKRRTDGLRGGMCVCVCVCVCWTEEECSVGVCMQIHSFIQEYVWGRTDGCMERRQTHTHTQRKKHFPFIPFSFLWYGGQAT